MKAASAETLPPDPERWAYEVKWDGMRVLTVIDGGDVSAWSGNGTDATTRFPELQALAGAVRGHSRVVLDGEVIAVDPATGRPDFGRLQPRMQAASACRSTPGWAARPAKYCATGFAGSASPSIARAITSEPSWRNRLAPTPATTTRAKRPGSSAASVSTTRAPS